MKLNFKIKCHDDLSPQPLSWESEDSEYDVYSWSEIVEHLVTNPAESVFMNKGMEAYFKNTFGENKYAWLKFNPSENPKKDELNFYIKKGDQKIKFAASLVGEVRKKDKVVMRFSVLKNWFAKDSICLNLLEARSRYMDGVGNFDSNRLMAEQNILMFDNHFESPRRRSVKSLSRKRLKILPIIENVDEVPLHPEWASLMNDPGPAEENVDKMDTDCEIVENERVNVPPRKTYKAEGEESVVKIYRDNIIKNFTVAAEERLEGVLMRKLDFDPSIKDVKFDVKIIITERKRSRE